jgi:hypothetical protein
LLHKSLKRCRYYFCSFSYYLSYKYYHTWICPSITMSVIVFTIGSCKFQSIASYIDRGTSVHCMRMSY